MIKINLLPVRAARRKENIRRQVSIFFLCFIFALSVMAYLTISMSQKVSSLTTRIQESQEELKKFEKIANRVKKIKKDLKTLEEKMDIIVKLEENRSGPVRFMDALTQLVVPEKIWLTSFAENQGKMELEGMASDNKTVADFMTNMEKMDLFENVDLVSSQQFDKASHGKKYKKFSITGNVSNKMSAKNRTAS